MEFLKRIKKICSKKDDHLTKEIKNLIDDKSIPLSDELKAEWKETYNKFSESLVITGRLEAEKFDKGILTLSSIFLGFTLTFVDKIVPLHTAWYKWLLFISWASFFFSIVSILVGLIISQKRIGQIIANAGKYLIGLNLNYQNFLHNKLTKWVVCSNYLSFILFVVGAGSFILFVIINVIKL
jgi:hypothetical protein